MIKEQIKEDINVSPISGLKPVMDDEFGFYHLYSGKWLYCKKCGSKSVCMDRQTFQAREEYIKTSKSKKSDAEKKEIIAIARGDGPSRFLPYIQRPSQ